MILHYWRLRWPGNLAQIRRYGTFKWTIQRIRRFYRDSVRYLSLTIRGWHCYRAGHLWRRDYSPFPRTNEGGYRCEHCDMRLAIWHYGPSRVLP